MKSSFRFSAEPSINGRFQISIFVVRAGTKNSRHDGINLGFYKGASNIFSGIMNSKVIGLLQNTSNVCGNIDTNWASMCRSFSENDPLALSNTCSSVLKGSVYQRVGIMLPQLLLKLFHFFSFLWVRWVLDPPRFHGLVFQEYSLHKQKHKQYLIF